jgi:hypothetical protein
VQNQTLAKGGKSKIESYVILTSGRPSKQDWTSSPKTESRVNQPGFVVFVKLPMLAG